MPETTDERTPDVVTFTYTTTCDYVVNLATGKVKREDNGEPADEPHYVALFCEGEFAGEYQLGVGDPIEPGDGELIDKAEELLEAAFMGGAVATSDAETLDRMNRILSAPSWSVGMLEDLCELLRATGRPVVESDYLHH